MACAFAEISFTTSALTAQKYDGSEEGDAKFLRSGADRSDAVEAEFISRKDGFYQATVTDADWPYVQFREGPA